MKETAPACDTFAIYGYSTITYQLVDVRANYMKTLEKLSDKWWQIQLSCRTTISTAEDPHVIIIADDGCRGYQSTTWVRVGWIIATTKGSNQSTRHVHDWLAYKGGEAHATCTQRVAPVLPILQRIRREGGQLRDKDGDLTGIFVKFAMGGDKPWLRHVLGQRSHNHTYFSHSCPCAQKDMYDMSQDHTSHYPCGEYGDEAHEEVLCRRAHVCPGQHLRGEPFTAFACPDCEKVWTHPRPHTEDVYTFDLGTYFSGCFYFDLSYILAILLLLSALLYI